jgi:putative peptidoglycan lipid II flippase
MAAKVFTTTFFANKDTGTPLIGGVVSIVSNLIFIVLLMPYMKHTGIALATSLSSWCNVLYLLFSLKKLGSLHISAAGVKECLKQFLASGVMLAAVWMFNIFYANARYIKGGFERNSVIIIVVCTGISVFYISGKILGIFNFLDDMKALEKEEKREEKLEENTEVDRAKII